jgi:hypothetical protein
MWTTLLDPRFNLRSNHWKDEAEKSNAKKLLMNSVEEVVCRIANFATQKIIMPSYPSSSDISDDEGAIDLFSSRRNDGSSAVDSSLSTTTAIEQAKAQGAQEVLSYLIATESIERPKFDPLEW